MEVTNILISVTQHCWPCSHVKSTLLFLLTQFIGCASSCLTQPGQHCTKGQQQPSHCVVVKLVFFFFLQNQNSPQIIWKESCRTRGNWCRGSRGDLHWYLMRWDWEWTRRGYWLQVNWPDVAVLKHTGHASKNASSSIWQYLEFEVGGNGKPRDFDTTARCLCCKQVSTKQAYSPS